MISRAASPARPARPPRCTMSSARLTKALKPCSGTSLMLMTGTPSRSSSRARSAMNCSRSGTTLTSTHSRLVDFDQVEQLHVLFERQRDVEVVDPLARRRSRRPRRACRAAAGRGSRGDRRRRGRRRSRRPDSRARGARGSGRRPGGRGRRRRRSGCACRPMPGAPAALEQLAHELARQIAEHDVEHEEDAPRRAARPRRRRVAFARRAT